jgi:hypothetical protein
MCQYHWIYRHWFSCYRKLFEPYAIAALYYLTILITPLVHLSGFQIALLFALVYFDDVIIVTCIRAWCIIFWFI